jgi:hypothetical protein
MRLLNSSKLTLHEFFGSNIPTYAILSHRWENEEVTFQDMRDGKGPRMVGWSKVTGCCAQAVLDGWEYAVSLDLLLINSSFQYLCVLFACFSSMISNVRCLGSESLEPCVGIDIFIDIFIALLSGRLLCLV